MTQEKDKGLTSNANPATAVYAGSLPIGDIVIKAQLR